MPALQKRQWRSAAKDPSADNGAANAPKARCNRADQSAATATGPTWASRPSCGRLPTSCVVRVLVEMIAPQGSRVQFLPPLGRRVRIERKVRRGGRLVPRAMPAARDKLFRTVPAVCGGGDCQVAGFVRRRLDRRAQKRCKEFAGHANVPEYFGGKSTTCSEPRRDFLTCRSRESNRLDPSYHPIGRPKHPRVRGAFQVHPMALAVAMRRLAVLCAIAVAPGCSCSQLPASQPPVETRNESKPPTETDTSNSAAVQHSANRSRLNRQISWSARPPIRRRPMPRKPDPHPAVRNHRLLGQPSAAREVRTGAGVKVRQRAAAPPMPAARSDERARLAEGHARRLAMVTMRRRSGKHAEPGSLSPR